MEGIPEDIRRVFVCAHDVSPIWHVKMQAAFQRYTDNAVSKTVNFPNSATKEEVAEVYCWPSLWAAKGTTIYRDGSRDEQVLNIGKVNDGKAPPATRWWTPCWTPAARHGLPDQIRSLRPYPARPRPGRHQRLYREGAHRLRQPLYHCQLRRERHL